MRRHPHRKNFVPDGACSWGKPDRRDCEILFILDEVAKSDLRMIDLG